MNDTKVRILNVFAALCGTAWLSAAVLQAGTLETSPGRAVIGKTLALIAFALLMAAYNFLCIAFDTFR